jgi:hypothetical protein
MDGGACMSLSYSLDVAPLQNLDKLSKALIFLGTTSAFTDIFTTKGEARFRNASGAAQDIFPTGEYIIRDGKYINGMFVYVGSYKAYCRDLFGSGSHGYAWDGFIMVMRGYTINGVASILEYSPSLDTYIPSVGFGFLPMRMPFEVNCGASGSASAIAADSSVGLHSLDIYKNIDDVSVTGGDQDARIMTCGFQRVNPSVESVPTGMDYVANLYFGTLLSYQTNTATLSTGERIVTYQYDPANIMQITWEASQTGHADKTFALGRFGMLRDLDQFLSVNSSITNLFYSYQDWVAGQKPDGTNPVGGPATGNDTRGITFNYYPRRFLDISCFSQTAVSATHSAESPFYIVGDFSLDTNNDGSIDDTCPLFIGGAYPYGSYLQAVAGISPFSYLGPFLNAAPAIATSLAVAPSWLKEDTSVAYNFSGACACSILIPYENTGSINYAAQPLSYIAVNDVTHSGSTYGEIYTFSESPLNPATTIFPFAVETGSFTTTTGISLPTRWYNKATQFRTFSIGEEDIGKAGQIDVDTGDFYPSSNSVYDYDAQEYIGWDGNYQRYGSFTNPLAPNQPQGTRSGAGYGFLGIRTGTGPIAIMFDSGSGLENVDGGGSFQGWTATILPEGANLNTNHLTDPTSTTRTIVNCGWDNDRDQWLFMTSDSGGFGAISAASDFTTASNNIGFLDQTANFTGINASSNAGMYSPITMSNAMDGWVWFGTLDTDSTVRFGITQTSLGTADSVTVDSLTYDTYPDASTEIRRITGTTGRTARVWVDYVLFDGVDSVIATKLKGLGMKVNIENVEWFKRNIIRTGDLNIKSEEIEEWMREQQSQYKEMLKTKERQGRLRKRKSQVSAFREGMEEQINPDFMDSEVKDYIDSFIPKERPPSPTEKKLERKRKGGYEPKQSSYYDEVFEDEP